MDKKLKHYYSAFDDQFSELVPTLSDKYNIHNSHLLVLFVLMKHPSYSIKDIATATKLSPTVAWSHLSTIYLRLGVSSRASLIIELNKLGLWINYINTKERLNMESPIATKEMQLELWRSYRKQILDKVLLLRVDPLRDERLYYLCDQLAHRLSKVVLSNSKESIDLLLSLPAELVKLMY